MALFDRYLGIDYSGAQRATDRLDGLRLFAAEGQSEEPEEIEWSVKGGKRWSRQALAHEVLDHLKQDVVTIVGIDHAFSYPISRMGNRDWGEFLADFADQWPTDRPVNDSRRLGTAPQHSSLFRITETWTSSAKSVFDWRPNGVAHSTHAGLPWIHYLQQQLEDEVFFWPFDGFVPPTDRSVIAETYPALYKRRYPRSHDSSHPKYLENPHQRDAYATCRWLQEQDRIGNLRHYFSPPLKAAEIDVVRREGWILGLA